MTSSPIKPVVGVSPMKQNSPYARMRTIARQMRNNMHKTAQNHRYVRRNGTYK